MIKKKFGVLYLLLAFSWSGLVYSMSLDGQKHILVRKINTAGTDFQSYTLSVDNQATIGSLKHYFNLRCNIPTEQQKIKAVFSDYVFERVTKPLSNDTNIVFLMSKLDTHMFNLEVHELKQSLPTC